MPDTHGIVVAFSPAPLIWVLTVLTLRCVAVGFRHCCFVSILFVYLAKNIKTFQSIQTVLYRTLVLRNTQKKKKIVLRSNMFWQNFPLEIWNVCQPIRGFMKHRGHAVSRYTPLIFGHILHLRSCFKAGRINEYLSVLSGAALQVLSQY